VRPIIPGRVSRLTLDMTQQCYMASQRGVQPKAHAVSRELRRALIVAFSVVDTRRRYYEPKPQYVRRF
jgi:hypothetical protein